MYRNVSNRGNLSFFHFVFFGKGNSSFYLCYSLAITCVKKHKPKSLWIWRHLIYYLHFTFITTTFNYLNNRYYYRYEHVLIFNRNVYWKYNKHSSLNKISFSLFLCFKHIMYYKVVSLVYLQTTITKFKNYTMILTFIKSNGKS